MPLAHHDRVSSKHSTVCPGQSAAENFTVPCHLALNPLKGEYTAKVKVMVKRLKAGGGEQYLLKVLTT